MVVFSFPIVMGKLMMLADFSIDFDDFQVEEYGGSNCVHLL